MKMGKRNKKFENLVTAFVNETFTDKGGDIAKLRSTITKLLFTPKLQWKSEEITNDGGDNLLGTKHTLQNIDLLVTVYTSVEHPSCSVIWNGRKAYTGTLNECKQFCSDKILNDFLKLCE